MNILNLQKCVFTLLILSLTLAACDKPDEDPTQPGDNYIRVGNTYYPLHSAVAIYDNSFDNTTFFSLELISDDDDLAFFDNLKVARGSELPAGTFVYYKPANVADFQSNKFHDIYLRYGSVDKTIIDSKVNTIQTGSLQVQKVNGQYWIKGTIIRDGNTIEVSYQGAVDHMEAW